MYFSNINGIKLLLKDPKLFINFYLYWGSQVAYMKLKGKKHRPSRYASRRVLPIEQGNQALRQAIEKGDPFMAGRFGSNELSLTRYAYFRKQGVWKAPNVLPDAFSIENCGFFPKEADALEKFGDVMLASLEQCDTLCVWYNISEDYFANKFGKRSLSLTHRKVLDFWNFDIPWTEALAGKKVLVIHPLDKLIEEQYENREKLFSNPHYLPEFELITLKSVQTIAGNKDPRFETWFDALEYMYQEAMKIDFDIALIGCGAYGFPLAAKIKAAGKQTIHMGGVTQILFGIKGNRWENDAEPLLMRCVNENWKKPSAQDVPKNAQQVEGNCYW